MPQPGEQVAWNTPYGTMAGEVISSGRDTCIIRRVDGGTCSVGNDILRKATYEDVEEAINQFAKIGRQS